MPTLEEMLASANGWFFLKEFFFSNTKFAPPGRTELELADGIVLFEDVLIVFQAKAREQPTSDPASEEKWFEKRVSRDAVKQVNDTLAYLRDHDIVLRNDRGDEVALPRGLKGLRIVSLVLYAPGSALPPHLRLRKGRLSTTAGMFVHFLPGGWVQPRAEHALYAPRDPRLLRPSVHVGVEARTGCGPTLREGARGALLGWLR